MTNLLKDEFWPGDELGDYRLLERIGAGGEASVWSAWDTDHKRVVALKFMQKNETSSTSDGVDSQADRLRNLDHINIRKIYQMGTAGQSIYFSMPYFPSGSLDDLLIIGALPVREVLRISAQIVNALEYLHTRNIVHRDLKPTNILLDAENRAYLTDFGIARSLSDSTQAYHTGQGTFRYSPPEQHTEAAISRGSDIYSLGIVIFEMLTGTLPWDGDVALAIRQLDTGEGIPDPREINLNFPAELLKALRSLTHIDPENRPSSAAEAFGLIVAALGRSPLDQVTHEAGELAVQTTLETISLEPDIKKLSQIEAHKILQDGMKGWAPGSQKFDLHLTQFAYLDSVYSSDGQLETDLDIRVRQFMTRGALTYDFNPDFWWERLDDPQLRGQLCEQVIANEEEEVIGRVLSLMLEAPPQVPLSEILPSSTASRLIDMALETSEPAMQTKAFDFIGQMVGDVGQDWNPVGFSQADDAKLANLALANNPLAVKVARLIGRIQSETAVNTLWKALDNGNEPRSLSALVEVLRVAGSLPDGLPSRIRMKVGRELTRKQLFSDWVSLLKAYVAAALAAALGLSYHVYATYRLPTFLNSARILNALGSGLLFGPLIGLGIFLTRLVVSRLRNVTKLPRVAIGVLLGGLVVNLSFFSYYLLFLDTNPTGWLLSFGSFLMVIGFGIGTGFFPSRVMRSLLGAATTGLGLGLSWVWSTSLKFTPMIYYESDQPVQTFLHICITSLMIGIVPNLVDSLDLNDHV
jgi:serine/threonine protein kinase